MIKLKPKSIENIAERAKERALGHLSEEPKIGIIAACDNFSGAANYTFKMAQILEGEINKLGLNTEIITLPTLNDRYKTYTCESNLIEVYKDQIENLTELMLTEKSYDGLVIIGKGISTTAGMLLGAIAVNIPTLVLTEGASSKTEGASLKDLTESVGRIAIGAKNIFDIQNDEIYQTELMGDGSNFNTANLFSILLESMGLSVMGTSGNFAGSAGKIMILTETAKILADLVKNRMTVKKLLNKKIIQNAIILNYALGGSINTLKILMEISKAIDADINLDKAFSLIKNVPVLVDTYKTDMYAFIKSGGTSALLKQLLNKNLIDGTVKRYNGMPLAEMLKETKVKEECVLPLRKESLIVFKGNIAESYALVKTINIPQNMTKFAGPSLVYEDDNSAASAVLSKGIKDGTVIVIKNCGSLSNGGIASVSETACAISSMNKTDKLVILTDGAICDSTNAIIVGNVTPESASGSIKYIQDGDAIEIDFLKARVSTDLSSKDFKQREKKYVNAHKTQSNFIKAFIKNRE